MARRPRLPDNYDEEPWLRHRAESGRRRVVRRTAGAGSRHHREGEGTDQTDLDEKLRELEMKLTAEQRHQARDRSIQRFREATSRSRHQRSLKPIAATVLALLVIGGLAFVLISPPKEAVEVEAPPPPSRIGADFLNPGATPDGPTAEESTAEASAPVLPAPAPEPIDPDEIPERIPSSDPSMTPVRDRIVAFLKAGTVEEKRTHLAKTAQLDQLLEQYRSHELMQARAPDNFGKSFYRRKDGSLVLAEVFLGLNRGFRPVVLESVDGEYLVDFASFIGHNEVEWADIPRIAQQSPVTLRVLARNSRQFPPPRPGDLVLELRDPDQLHIVFAAASVVALGEDYIVEGLKLGVPLPITVRLESDIADSGSPYLRIRELVTPGWYVGADGKTIRVPDSLKMEAAGR